jgi:hypothetical protein
VLRFERYRYVQPAGGHVGAQYAAVVLLGLEREPRAPLAQLGQHPPCQLVTAGRYSDSEAATLGASKLGRHELRLLSGGNGRARRVEDGVAGLA